MFDLPCFSEAAQSREVSFKRSFMQQSLIKDALISSQLASLLLSVLSRGGDASVELVRYESFAWLIAGGPASERS